MSILLSIQQQLFLFLLQQRDTVFLNTFADEIHRRQRTYAVLEQDVKIGLDEHICADCYFCKQYAAAYQNATKSFWLVH